jgi:hypothetical protein
MEEAKNAKEEDIKIVNNIEEVIVGSQKTYRYILITALLALATEPKVNPLCLQASSSMEGAYDARSLCHKVIVPFEKKYLEDRLGGSNEPYLNNPARFKEISLTNAVRGGKSKEILKTLHSILSSIQPQDAFQYLVFCIKCTLKRKPKGISSIQLSGASLGNRSPVIKFVESLMMKTSQGETSALITAALFQMLAGTYDETFYVEAHSVNQSGASSNEVSDIDVYHGPELLFTIEVKDKDFNEHDIEHAVKKAMDVGSSRLFFVCGFNAKLETTQKSLDDISSSYSENYNFDLVFFQLLELTKFLTAFAPQRYLENFLIGLEKSSKSMNITDQTRDLFQEQLSIFGWSTIEF